MTAVDQVPEVFDGRRLVLNHNEDQVERQSRDGFLITRLVDGTHVRDALNKSYNSIF